MATRAKWIITLEKLMDAQGVTPRSLSLQAGLNETAVRDILMGRAKFPRYDTLKSIADVLGTTPAFLMGDDKTKTDLAKGKIPDPAQLELLTEIIARASEVNGGLKKQARPKEFAASVMAIYKKLLADGGKQASKDVGKHVVLKFKTQKR